MKCSAVSESSQAGFIGSINGRIGRLLGLSGRATVRATGRQTGRARPAFAQAEMLESRILLGGDHPSFVLPLTPTSGTEITLDGSGQGTVGGVIGTAGDDDLFRFTFAGASPDFVTVWADTVNAGSSLDSLVELYSSSGILLSSGASNGSLTSGLFSDGWVGFVAQPGTTYYARVRSDVTAGTRATGAYTIRVDAQTTAVTLDGNGLATVAANHTLVGGDIVYAVTTGSGAGFESLATATASADAADFDSRLDVYSSTGSLIVADSQSAFQTSAFLVWRGHSSTTTYVRVRSDQVNTANQLATGAYQLRLSTIATSLAADPVVRQLSATGSMADPDSNLAGGFIAQGTGLTIITTKNTNPFVPQDMQTFLYSDAGSLIAFGDDFIGRDAQIEVQLTGGLRYWFVVAGFDDAASTSFATFIETNHTFNPLVPLDDHRDLLTTGTADEIRRNFEAATPVVFGPPVQQIDGLLGAPMNDHNFVQIAQGTGRIHGATDTDLFQFTSPMNLLGFYAGADDGLTPANWLTNGRPATRGEVWVSALFDGFADARVQIFDSTFAEIFDSSNAFNPAPPFTDPAGVSDPSRFPPNLNIMDHGLEFNSNFDTFLLWGGETYYLAVSSVTTVGRYSLGVTTDAFTAVNGLGVRTEQIGQFTEIAEEGRFGSANQILLSSDLGDGSASGFRNTRVFNPTADGLTIIQQSGVDWLGDINDTDLYFFTAPATGTAEIRIWTEGVVTDYTELHFLGPFLVFQGTRNKEINSALDGALRIFNNDFQQIAYVNDNPAVTGEREVEEIGGVTRTMYHRDPRVVIPVEAGKVYFVQVESGQRWKTNAADPTVANRTATPAGEVDWRRAAGLYLLAIDSQPTLGFEDDHSDAPNDQATVIPMDSAAGTASMSGVIFHTLFNPTDTDSFMFLAPGEGVAQITVARESGGPLIPSIDVIDARTGLLVASESANSSGVVSVGVPAKQGDSFIITVSGSAGTEGGYDLTISGVPAVDDFAGLPAFANGQPLEILDFLGSATINGVIEDAGDLDVFTFQANAFDLAEVSVTALDGTFNPVVSIFEVSEDPAGLPVLLRIGFNDDTAPGNLNSTAVFPITAANRTSLATMNTYNTYYVVVGGSDPETTQGAYQLALSLTPTDDHPDAGQFGFASTVTVDSATGLGTAPGVLEASGDTDLLRFTAPAGGEAELTVTSPTTSLLRPRVRIFDGAFNPVADLDTSALFKDGDDTSVSVATFRFISVRNATYYVQVEGFTGGAVKTADSGVYTIDITAPTADDYPNITEFSLASEIPLSAQTGDGAVDIAQIGVDGDTDLFFFESLAAGPVVVTIATPASEIAPRLRIFDASTALAATIVDGGAGDEDGSANGTIVTTISATAAGEVRYLLVDVDPADTDRTGAFTVGLNGDGLIEPPPPGGEDDHADSGEFDLATAVSLSTRTGFGSATGSVELGGDTDLFRFTSLAAGRVFVQIVTPSGTLLDAALLLYNSARQLVTQNTEGIPGANASLSFTTLGSELFYAEVDGVGTGTGSYTLRVSAEPETYHLVMPAGFASDQIREFVSIANPSATETVAYSVTLYFEDTSLAPVALVQNATLAAGRRGGLTISNGPAGRLPGVPANEAYSIVIVSSAPLGATLSRYDFGSAVGESFTGRTSASWSFARVQRAPGTADDFVTVFNPNSTAVLVKLTAYTAAGVVELPEVQVSGMSRGGWNINDTTQLPTGIFGVRVTSRPVSTTDAHIGVVAAMTHFDAGAGASYMQMGDPDGGTLTGVIPQLTSSPGVVPEVSILNTGSVAASVTIRGSYINAGLPDFTRIIDVGARSTRRLTAADLGITASQAAGLRYTSTLPVTVSYSEAQFGDGNGTGGQTQAGTAWFFGDAFINSVSAGVKYFETLSFYNPDDISVSATVNFYFSDGTTASTSVSIAGDSFVGLDLHGLPAIVSRGGLNFFGIEVIAAKPIVVTMNHYDLFLGGGWTSGGAPIGLLNPLDTILV